MLNKFHFPLSTVDFAYCIWHFSFSKISTLSVCTFFGISNAMCCAERAISSYAALLGCFKMKRTIRLIRDNLCRL
ncbi:hypothetical protein TPS_08506 [Trichinella pseudospiralis]